jgi:3-oxoacyl-(acyl-carrier-protein) synthase
MDRRVVISGVGAICAAGVGIEEIWQRLLRSPPVATPFAGPPPVDHLVFPAFQSPAYELGELGVPRRCLRWLADEGLGAERDLSHLLGATALALRDAGLDTDLRGQDPPVAVVIADESPGFGSLSQSLFELEEAPIGDPVARYRHLADDFFQLNTFLLPYYVARAFGCEGLALFVNAACTSGLSALEIAAQEIRCGRSRWAIAAAADDPLSAAKFLWFSSLGLYSASGVIRPFDAAPLGTVFGDAGSALVVEDLESASARGARIYGEYLGASFAQDGWKVTVPSPSRALAARAMQTALARSGVEAGEIDLVVPHGTGTAASDGYEALVLHRLFAALPRWPSVAAWKPLFGHNLGGSALLESALLLAAMERGAIPPTLGHQQAMVRHPIPLTGAWSQRRVDYALKLTCGFAGYFGAAVFARPTAERAARSGSGGR